MVMSIFLRRLRFFKKQAYRSSEGRIQIFRAVFGSEKSPSRKYRVSPPVPPLQRKVIVPSIYREKPVSSNDPAQKKTSQDVFFYT